MKKLLFDMDGTLLDSMGMWHNFHRYFEDYRDNKKWSNDMEVDGNTSTFNNGVTLLKRMIDPKVSDSTMKQIMNSILIDFYTRDVKVKENVESKLKELHKKGYQMYLATATDIFYAKKAMEFTGLDKYIVDYITPDTCGYEKDDIKYYQYALDKINSQPENTVFFDDVFYTVNLSTKLGIKTIGVYDKHAKDIDLIKEKVDFYINDFSEINEDIL